MLPFAGQDKGFVPMDVGISEAGWGHQAVWEDASDLKMTRKQQPTRKHTKSTAKSYSIINNDSNKNIINNNIIIINNNTNNHNPEYIQKLQQSHTKSIINNTIIQK